MIYYLAITSALSFLLVIVRYGSIGSKPRVLAIAFVAALVGSVLWVPLLLINLMRVDADFADFAD